MPMPVPTISPMPREDLIFAASAASNHPKLCPAIRIPKSPITAPRNHTPIATGPIMYPTATSIGESHMPPSEPKLIILLFHKTAGILPSQSLTNVNTAAAPILIKSIPAFLPPLSPTCRVCAAATPMGYVISASLSTTKYFLISAVNIRPRVTPANVIITNITGFTFASGSSIQIPGTVNASPPATIAPADMAVCVTLISFRLVLPHALRANIETSATNIIGQGNELNFSAMNMELIVIITAPAPPIIIPLTVSCLSLIIVLLFLFK